jgi:nitrite reductase/ring-hydroxylating ferredoxin subunit
MNISKSKYWLVLLVLVSCNRDLSDDPIPFQAFADIVIALNQPAYASLSTDGGYKAESGGVRGIIIYRVNSTTYYAYERNCSFQPSGACATVDVHSSGLFMIDTCCNSSFGFTDGNPTGGPAWRPLLRYRTQLSGQTLTITDDVIN